MLVKSLVETKARIGVCSIALGAYLPQFPSLVPEFEGQYEDFKKMLPDTVEIIDGGIVTTKELAMDLKNNIVFILKNNNFKSKLISC